MNFLPGWDFWPSVSSLAMLLWRTPLENICGMCLERRKLPSSFGASATPSLYMMEQKGSVPDITRLAETRIMFRTSHSPRSKTFLKHFSLTLFWHASPDWIFTCHKTGDHLWGCEGECGLDPLLSVTE
jgi:hypothetical protein